MIEKYVRAIESLRGDRVREIERQRDRDRDREIEG